MCGHYTRGIQVNPVTMRFTCVTLLFLQLVSSDTIPASLTKTLKAAVEETVAEESLVTDALTGTETVAAVVSEGLATATETSLLEATTATSTALTTSAVAGTVSVWQWNAWTILGTVFITVIVTALINLIRLTCY
eukprot:Blabericola_migrator_1__11830@NODE_719_length_6741_cov_45_534312_g518_i0_p5_GENE_NODE_719_length_6741_cov_45_534312_g518_i0NODE_719_length_6741_cov_45_534312_g518_i0_p5_ORF_typecomplete_len135_score10_23DUF4454/PF14628_6/0_0015CEL_III_C/PF18054_1/0_12_NODE_719_length_6741_cov_45_534312_g518_i051045508